MVGNKSEMEDQREVTYERAVEMAKMNKISRVFETSAKTGYNVEEVFATVAKELYLQAKAEEEKVVDTPTPEVEPTPGIKIGETSNGNG